MKRRMAAAALLCCFLACAGAQAQRQAVAAPQDAQTLIAMIDVPDDGGRLVMGYTSGAPLEVLRDAGNGYVLAQSGVTGAGVMGYVKKENLRLGDTAPRVVQPTYYRVEFAQEMPVYAYPDAGAQVIGSCVPGKAYYWMGISADGYAQLCLPPAIHIWQEADRMTKGFVPLYDGEESAAMSERVTPWMWTVQPRFGEAAEETVIALAKEYVLEHGEDAAVPEAFLHADTLDALCCRAERMQTLDSLIGDWWVYFWEEKGGDVVRVYVWPDGGMDKGAVMSLDYLTEHIWPYIDGVIPFL